MRLMRITDGGDNISCTVMAPAPKIALGLESVKDYFEDQLEQNKEDFGKESALKIEVIPYDDEIYINFDCGLIVHTAREWADIYEGLGSMMICASEY
jgi:hypothetical protein